MKCPSSFLIEFRAALFLLILLVFSAPLADAQSNDTYWTSREGVTIWARLTGMHGSSVILVRSGREYRVPVSRLTPESAEKARRLLGLPATESRSDHALEVKEVKLPVDSELSNNAMASAGPMDLSLPEIPEPREGSTDPYPGVLPEKGEIPPPLALTHAPVGRRSGIRLEHRRAFAPPDAPSIVRAAIEAGNNLQDKRYKWGGGRARLEDNGYDCSGSVSYVLIKAGLLRSPLTSGAFTRYGQPGPGRWITIYARNGHVFMTLCGLRLDTGGHAGRGESGPRWCPNSRSARGFVVRHPPGF